MKQKTQSEVTVNESKQYTPDELNSIALEATQQMLNESKHTPGPWDFDFTERGKDKCKRAMVKSGNYETICVCSGLNGTEPGETAKANARLIAAAPDMLELLKWISKVTNSPEIGIKCDEIIKKATNA